MLEYGGTISVYQYSHNTWIPKIAKSYCFNRYLCISNIMNLITPDNKEKDEDNEIICDAKNISKNCFKYTLFYHILYNDPIYDKFSQELQEYCNNLIQYHLPKDIDAIYMNTLYDDLLDLDKKPSEILIVLVTTGNEIILPCQEVMCVGRYNPLELVDTLIIQIFNYWENVKKQCIDFKQNYINNACHTFTILDIPFTMFQESLLKDSQAQLIEKNKTIINQKAQVQAQAQESTEQALKQLQLKEKIELIKKAEEQQALQEQKALQGIIDLNKHKIENINIILKIIVFIFTATIFMILVRIIKKNELIKPKLRKNKEIN